MMSNKSRHSISVHACMFNHELLVAYASGNVDTHERGTVERHLAQCAKCRREITELERVWWSLDTWEEECETIEPRLHDLRSRIAASQKQIPLWQQWYNHLNQYITSAFDAIQTKPALAFGMFLVAALFAAPFAKQYWVENPESNTHAPAIAQHTIEQNQSVQLASNQIEVAKATAEQSVMTFDEALERSIQDENQSNIERNQLYSGYQNLRSVNVGYTPNANALPAHEITADHRPKTYNPLMYYDSYPGRMTN